MGSISKRAGQRSGLQRGLLFSGLGLIVLLGVVMLLIYPKGEEQQPSVPPGPQQIQVTRIDNPAVLPLSPTVLPTPSPTLIPTPRKTATPTPTPGISTLLLGTNLALQNGNDQVLTSATTRALIQQMHAGIIRIPTRSDLPEATLVQGSEINPNALKYDTAVITDMNTLFGKGIVYYEYGNEEDFLGVAVDKYTASWNSIIPQLKKQAFNGRFIGPVNYHYDPVYLKAFLQVAQPRPDLVSWHEYVCSATGTNADCMAHLDNWNGHMAVARATMQATMGIVLPIMITEWNYSPVTNPNDGKNNDPAFMTAWTTKALQVLAANGIYAAMQYSCTGSAIPLIDSNSVLTAQGMVFKNIYHA